MQAAKIKLPDVKEACKIAESDYAVAEVSATEALQDVKEKKERLTQAQESLSAIEHKFIKLFGFKQSLAEAKEAVEIAQNDLDAANLKYQRAHTVLNSCLNRIADRKAECSRIINEIQELETRVISIEDEVAALAVVLEEKRSILETTRADLEKAESFFNVLDQSITALQSEVDEIWEKVRKANSGELKEIKNVRKSFRKQMRDLHKKEKDLFDKTEELQKQKQSLEYELKRVDFKRKYDPKALFSCCMIFNHITEETYQRYLGISKTIQASEIIRFGNQQHKTSEWEVIEVNDEDALLLGPVIDKKPYDDAGITKTWEDSSLCRWLNEEYFTNSFDEFEQEAMTYAGKKHGYFVAIPNKSIILEIANKVRISDNASWWSLELIPADETEEFKQFKKKYIKEHMPIERFMNLINKVKDCAKGCIKNGIDSEQLKASISGYDDSVFNDIILDDICSEKSRFLPMLITRSVLKGCSNDFIQMAMMASLISGNDSELWNMFEKMEDKELRDFRLTLESLRLEAVVNYEGNIFVEEKHALKIIGNRLDSKGSNLTDIAEVRPIIWVPYYSGTHNM